MRHVVSQMSYAKSIQMLSWFFQVCAILSKRVPLLWRSCTQKKTSCTGSGKIRRSRVGIELAAWIPTKMLSIERRS